jgi:hypothetical protein
VLLLAVAAAFFGYQHPWSTSTGTAAGQTATASRAPASGPQTRATSASLTLAHGFGFDLGDADIKRFPSGTDDDVNIDLAFDGEDVAFSKTVQVAPWPSARPPDSADACRTAVTTTGLSRDDNRRTPAKGDAYCFITEENRVGFSVWPNARRLRWSST